MIAESMVDRYGGEIMGKIILNEGDGGGYASYPWILDKYERELCLRPAEAWLLKRLLKHAWDYGTDVYVSMRKIEREALITRKSVMGLFRTLENFGYIAITQRGDPDNPLDCRIRYDVSGALVALAFCVITDPTSKWSKANEARDIRACLRDEIRKYLPDEFKLGELPQLCRESGNYKHNWSKFAKYIDRWGG